MKFLPALLILAPLATLAQAPVGPRPQAAAKQTPAPVPTAVRPWPAQAASENFEVRIISEDRAGGATSYASPHFHITSSIKLPVGVVRDLAAVFEATRVAVRGLPLNLHIAKEPDSYPVRMFSNPQDYLAAGGAQATAGFYNGEDMLLSLPSLGIEKSTNGLTMAHQQHMFVLKHEVTHQVMGAWNGYLPIWLREGMAECMAATPYTRGRYNFTGLDSAFRDYLLKWRKSKDQRSVKLVPIGTLLSTSTDEWQKQVSAGAAFDYYNTASLLTYWLLHHDGKGDAGGLAAYFAALAGGMDSREAMEQFVIRGRKPDEIEGELRALCRKFAIQVDKP